MGYVTNYKDRHGNPRYRIQRKVGMRQNAKGEWVPHIKSFTGKGKKEAEQKYHEYMAGGRKEQNNAAFSCLGEALDTFSETVFKKTDLANSTKRKYLAAYKQLLQNQPLAGRPLEEVTALDLQMIYNNLTVCYSTRRALHNFLGRFYRYTELNDICPNITRSLVVPRGDSRVDCDTIDVWDDEDLNTVISALEGDPLRLLVILAVCTGARFAELLALTYEDIDGDRLSINKQLYEMSAIDDKDDIVLHLEPTKSKSSNRVIPLSEVVMEEIERHKQLQKNLMKKYHYDNHGYLFTTSHGTLYYKRNVARALKRLYKRTGVPYHKFHAYRHTFGTNLSRVGTPIEVTSKLMGHASIDITAKYYINVEAERRRDAVEAITKFTAPSMEGPEDE